MFVMPVIVEWVKRNLGSLIGCNMNTTLPVRCHVNDAVCHVNRS